MKLKACKNVFGHFYDGDLYDECPECSKNKGVSKPVKTIPVVEDYSFASQVSGDNEATQSAFQSFSSNDVSIDSEATVSVFATNSYSSNDDDNEKTQSIFGMASNTSDDYDDALTQSVFSVRGSSEENYDDEKTQSVFGMLPQSQPTTNVVMENIEVKIDETTKTARGNIVDYYNSQLSRHKSGRKEITEPVVGWLVCLSGKNQGKSYPLYNGTNSVGRNSENTVVLSQDITVSREKHCFIDYNASSGSVNVNKGQASGITYLNGQIVEKATEMAVTDKISLGAGEYAVVKLCDGSFKWN